jgi:magnesium transporter
MLPPAAAHVLTRLEDAPAMALLRAGSTQAAVGILRHVAEPARSRMLAALPPATAVATQLLLGFPDDTVGAWTDPDVAALAPNLSAGEALQQIRAADAADVDTVYVVDSGRHLHGQIGLQALLRAPETTPLTALMRPAGSTLAAMMPIGSALTLGAWQHAGALPVVDHDRRLLGVLRRGRLAQATRGRMRAARPGAGEASVIGVLAGSYWAIVSGLVGAALALLPPVKRVRPDE